MDDLVEIIRQRILVFRQRIEAFLRSLKFADFTRNIGMFERFGGFAALARKCFAVNIGCVLPDTRRADFRSTALLVLSVWMLSSLYRHDQA